MKQFYVSFVEKPQLTIISVYKGINISNSYKCFKGIVLNLPSLLEVLLKLRLHVTYKYNISKHNHILQLNSENWILAIISWDSPLKEWQVWFTTTTLKCLSKSFSFYHQSLVNVGFSNVTVSRALLYSESISTWSNQGSVMCLLSILNSNRNMAVTSIILYISLSN